MYKGALSVLKWAYGHYGDQLVYACSFGIEGIVLIDLIAKVKKMRELSFEIQVCILRKHTTQLMR
ncbi:Phosphoadenosine phosphosulfate reductase [Bacillus safensis subsp. safensis]